MAIVKILNFSIFGAEVCELVGLFLLNEIKSKFPELEFGIYRDDCLAIHRRIPGPRMERIKKKEIVALFKSYKLRINIVMNLETTNFLDIIDLANEKFKPYR